VTSSRSAKKRFLRIFGTIIPAAATVEGIYIRERRSEIPARFSATEALRDARENGRYFMFMLRKIFFPG
jgi:hypothetical protein